MPDRAARIGWTAVAVAAVAALAVASAWVRIAAVTDTGGSAMVLVPDGFPGTGPPDVTPLASAPAVTRDEAVLHASHGQSGCDGECLPFGHWGRYGFGPDELAAKRGFWLIDRTGDAAANRALRDVVVRWNASVEANAAPGVDLPHVGYYRDDAHAGNCSPDPAAAEAYFLPDYSVLLACNGRLLDALGRAYTLPGGAHWGVGLIPWLFVDARDEFCNGGPMSHEQLVSAFAHEMGHTLGLDHRRGLTLMNSNASGVCAGLWFDSHDWEALRSVYGHPADA